MGLGKHLREWLRVVQQRVEQGLAFQDRVCRARLPAVKCAAMAKSVALLTISKPLLKMSGMSLVLSFFSCMNHHILEGAILLVGVMGS